MDPEKIMKNSVYALRELVKELVGEKDHEQLLLPLKNWDVLWELIKKWLVELPLTDRDSTILLVVKHYLPNAQQHIEISLSIHNDFWDEFYKNMLKAKALLIQ